MSRPPDGRMRTKRVTPFSWTRMFVTVAPMSTMASSPPSSSSMPTSGMPTARAMANGTRSTPIGSSFAASATSTTVFTIARCAATRMSRSMRRPSCSNSPSGSKSRTASSTGMGMNSCAWNPSDARSSFSGSHGSAISRTTTRWFPTPMYTWRLLKPPRCHSSRRASLTISGWRISPASTAPSGSGTCAARTTTGASPPWSSAARTAVAPISSPTRTFAIYGPSVRTERSSKKRSRSVSRSR